MDKYNLRDRNEKLTLNEIVDILKKEFHMVEFDKEEIEDLKKDPYVKFRDIQYCLYTEDPEILNRLQVPKDDEIEEPERDLYKNDKEYKSAQMYYKIQKGDRINIILEGKKNLLTNYTVQGQADDLYHLLNELRELQNKGVKK